MKIHFFERKYIEGIVSIEKLFDVLKIEFEKKGHQVINYKNPYNLNKFFLSWIYFWKNQSEINHITGDIHWVGIVLNPNKTILTIHDLIGLNYLSGIRKKIYFFFWLYLPIKRLKFITVISDKTKEELVKHFPWAENKIQVIPNFLTINPPNNVIEKNNPKPNVLIIGTRINKNIEIAFDALVGLDISLNIVGQLTMKQEEFLLQNKIEYTQFFNLSEDLLIKLYVKTDILLFASTYEGFGLPILEAQAYNCAVITSNLSPMKEVAGEGAILVNPNDVNDVKNALFQFINNVSLREKITKKGLINVQQYSAENIASKYIDLYRKICSKN